MFHSIIFVDPEHSENFRYISSDGIPVTLTESDFETGTITAGYNTGNSDTTYVRTKNKIHCPTGTTIANSVANYITKIVIYTNDTSATSGYSDDITLEGAYTYTISENTYIRLTVRKSPIAAFDSAAIQQLASSISILKPIEGVYNTYSDWYLVPSKRPVFATPAVKKHVVEIPGGDGAIDMTEALAGRPTYSNRTGSFEFIVLNDFSEYGPKVYDWVAIHEDLMTFLHGQRRYAVLEDDPGYFYDGRFTVDSWTSENDYARVVIGYEVAPFKYKVDPTDITLETGTIGIEFGADAEATNSARSVGTPIAFRKGDRIRMESSGLYGNVHHLTQVMYYPGSTIASYRSGGYVAHTYNEGGNEYVFTKDGYYRFVFEKYDYTNISASDLNEIKSQIRLYERGLL